MNLRQVLLILRLRWWLVLRLLAHRGRRPLGISAAAAQAVHGGDVAAARHQGRPAGGHAGAALRLAARYIATQIEIIQSERVAGRVVQDARAGEQPPSAVEQWREETEGRVPLETYYGKLLLKGLKVEPGARQQPGEHLVHRPGPEVRRRGAPTPSPAPTWTLSVDLQRRAGARSTPASSTSASSSCAPTSRRRRSGCRRSSRSAASSSPTSAWTRRRSA